MRQSLRRHLPLFPLLNQFNFVTLGRVDERDGRAAGSGRRAIGKLEAMPGEVPGEFIEAFDFKRQVGEVRLDLDGFATGKITEFNFLFAAGGFEENELRAARRFVPPDLREAEHVAIEFNSAFEIVDAIASVQKFADFAHARKIARSPGFESKIGAAQSRFLGWGRTPLLLAPALTSWRMSLAL